MIEKVTSVEIKDLGQSGVHDYVVTKVVREQAERFGEAIDPIPKNVVVYKGEDRIAAQRAHDEAQVEMYK